MDNEPYEYCDECGTPLSHTYDCKAGYEEHNKAESTGCKECGSVGGSHYSHCSRLWELFGSFDRPESESPIDPAPDRSHNPFIIDPSPPPAGMTGWTCPRCARGNSPFTSTCPCIPLPGPVIT